MAFHRFFFTLIHHFAVFFRMYCLLILFNSKWSNGAQRNTAQHNEPGPLNRSKHLWYAWIFIPCYHRRHACNWFNPHTSVLKIFEHFNVINALYSVQTDARKAISSSCSNHFPTAKLQLTSYNKCHIFIGFTIGLRISCKWVLLQSSMFEMKTKARIKAKAKACKRT